MTSRARMVADLERIGFSSEKAKLVVRDFGVLQRPIDHLSFAHIDAEKRLSRRGCTVTPSTLQRPSPQSYAVRCWGQGGDIQLGRR